jgi:hypothetical protein
MSPVSSQRPSYAFLPVLTGLFTATLLITNVLNCKVIRVGALPFTGGLITLLPPFDVTREVSFDYRDPGYDPWNRRFIGFRKVRVQSPGEQTVETTYWYGPCQRAIKDCVDSSDEDPYATQIGLPVKIDRYESVELSQQGLGWLSTTTLNYTDPEDLFPSFDPVAERHVRRSYPYAVRTYLYDPTKIAESGGHRWLPPEMHSSAHGPNQAGSKCCAWFRSISSETLERLRISVVSTSEKTRLTIRS